ncbi:MAG: hypothetical protein GSR85_07710 [Desulfurococcales archaeon]|nr:hypothetical protein [Desulfurococcales archaeon]
MAYPAPLFSSVVSLVGIIILLRQYVSGAKLYKLLFALQLLDMMVGQVLEFLASTAGWTINGYRLYYFSSPLSAALLGLAVIALTGRNRLFKVFLVYVIILTVILGVQVVRAEPSLNKLEELGPFVGGEAMPGYVRILSPLLTIPSGIIILILAAEGFLKTRNQAYAGILAGNIIFMIAGALLRQGYAEAFLWLELLATIVLAYSFIKS